MNHQTDSAYFASKAEAEIRLSRTARARRVRDSHARMAASYLELADQLLALNYSTKQFHPNLSR
jgi:hypothetical protein